MCYEQDYNKHDRIFETTVNNIFQNPLEGYEGLS